jgi:hypothetical protein
MADEVTGEVKKKPRISAKLWALQMGLPHEVALIAKGGAFAERVVKGLFAQREMTALSLRVSRLTEELKQAQSEYEEAKFAAKDVDVCKAEIQKVVDAL